MRGTKAAPENRCGDFRILAVAYPLFRALGDAIETGPTGNNLRDLRILLGYQKPCEVELRPSQRAEWIWCS
jgi:hypothetical protein